ncbi:MAG TPA: dihydrofolate reductase family protein [archaeon]|nr:dihydrofolate reductase family protein [archaeon]
MKVIVYMAMTANGLIATERDDVWFVSKASWKSFNRMSRRAGNLVMGRRTLDVSIKGTEPYASDGSFPYPGRLNVIVSRRRIRNRWGKDVVFVRSPRAALAELRKRGFKMAFVAGGGGVNASFLQSGLVDELFLDVEAAVLGKGIPLFAPFKGSVRLRLLGVKRLAPDTVQLRYRVRG